jgi:hypothetical protein
VQLTQDQKEELEGLEEDPLERDPVRTFIDDHGAYLYEYHVTNHPRLIEFVNPDYREMHGGSLSLAIGDERPIIEIGQDDVVFSQYIYSALTGMEMGKSQVRPKSEGDAVMVSVFVGPSIGCGALTMVEPNGALDRINAIQKSDDAMVEYKDIESAIEVRGDNGVRKNQFASWQDIQDTLCLTFDHGKNREGIGANAQTPTKQKMSLTSCTDSSPTTTWSSMWTIAPATPRKGRPQCQCDELMVGRQAAIHASKPIDRWQHWTQTASTPVPRWPHPKLPL